MSATGSRGARLRVTRAAALLPMIVLLACDLETSKTEPAKADAASASIDVAKAPPEDKGEVVSVDAPAGSEKSEAPAEGRAALPPGELDEALAQDVVIGPMNDICPDTYCEGAYDWTFKSLSCKSGNCKLAFEAKHHDTNKKFTDARLDVRADRRRGSTILWRVRSLRRRSALRFHRARGVLRRWHPCTW